MNLIEKKNEISARNKEVYFFHNRYERSIGIDEERRRK